MVHSDVDLRRVQLSSGPSNLNTPKCICSLEARTPFLAEKVKGALKVENTGKLKYERGIENRLVVHGAVISV